MIRGMTILASTKSSNLRNTSLKEYDDEDDDVDDDDDKEEST